MAGQLRQRPRHRPQPDDRPHRRGEPRGPRQGGRPRPQRRPGHDPADEQEEAVTPPIDKAANDVRRAGSVSDRRFGPPVADAPGSPGRSFLSSDAMLRRGQPGQPIRFHHLSSTPKLIPLIVRLESEKRNEFWLILAWLLVLATLTCTVLAGASWLAGRTTLVTNMPS